VQYCNPRTNFQAIVAKKKEQKNLDKSSFYLGDHSGEKNQKSISFNKIPHMIIQPLT
jgi:hypothetical protein